MLIFVMIILWLVVRLASENKHNTNVSVNEAVTNNSVSTIIETYVLNVYRSNMKDKRETIVKLLHRLTEYEDPGDFLERHGYIHEYIFNIYERSS